MPLSARGSTLPFKSCAAYVHPECRKQAEDEMTKKPKTKAAKAPAAKKPASLQFALKIADDGDVAKPA